MVNTEDFDSSVMGSNPVGPTIVQKNPLWIGDIRRGMKRDGRSLLTSATVGSIPTCTTFLIRITNESNEILS